MSIPKITEQTPSLGADHNTWGQTLNAFLSKTKTAVNALVDLVTAGRLSSTAISQEIGDRIQAEVGSVEQGGITDSFLAGKMAEEGSLTNELLTSSYIGARVAVGDGVDPTGVADSTPAIQAALDSAGGRAVVIPPGRYRVAGLTIPTDSTLLGFGQVTFQSVAGSDGPIIDLTNRRRVLIDGIDFEGSDVTGATVMTNAANPIGTQVGILITAGSLENIVRECRFANFGYAAIQASSIGAPGYTSNLIESCFIRNCFYGLLWDTRGEYITAADVVVNACRFGATNRAGNNSFIGCHFNANHVGFHLADGENNGHGSAVGCSFNHNINISAQFDATTAGYALTGCQFFDGRLVFNNTAGIMISGSEFGTLSIEANGGGANRIVDSFAVGTVTVTHDMNGNHSELKLINVFRADGSLVDPPPFRPGYIPADSVVWADDFTHGSGAFNNRPVPMTWAGGVLQWIGTLAAVITGGQVVITPDGLFRPCAVDAGLADGVVTVRQRSTSNNNTFGAALGRYLDTSNFIQARLNPATNMVELQKRVAGTTTTVASAAHTYTPGDKISLVMQGNQVSVRVNGTQKIAPQTIAEFVTVTKHGFIGSGSAGTTVTVDDAEFRTL